MKLLSELFYLIGVQLAGSDWWSCYLNCCYLIGVQLAGSDLVKLAGSEWRSCYQNCSI